MRVRKRKSARPLAQPIPSNTAVPDRHQRRIVRKQPIGEPPSRGYSLLELTLTLILLGIIGFIVVPRFFNRSTYGLTSFYDRFVAALDYARAVAVASNCPVNVQVTRTGFTLVHASNTSLCPAGPALPVKNPATGGDYAGTAPSGAAFTKGAGITYAFGPNGAVGTGAGHATITLQGKAGAVLSVTIYRSTGYVARG